jgi:hypothetical protein
MKFSQGYLWLGSIRGAPIRIHWTTPVGAFLISGLAVLPGAWAAFFVLVLCHELGHAFIVKAYGFEVVAVDVNGLGGLCHWNGAASPFERSLIAWGGVFGQLVVLAAAFPLRWYVAPHFEGEHAYQFFHALVSTNVYLMAINLLPVRPLDGAEAWPIFGLLYRRLVGWKRRRRARSDEARRAEMNAAASASVERLDELDEADPPPMPPEVEAVLDRILDEAHLAKQARRAKNRP